MINPLAKGKGSLKHASSGRPGFQQQFRAHCTIIPLTGFRTDSAPCSDRNWCTDRPPPGWLCICACIRFLAGSQCLEQHHFFGWQNVFVADGLIHHGRRTVQTAASTMGAGVQFHHLAGEDVGRKGSGRIHDPVGDQAQGGWQTCETFC